MANRTLALVRKMLNFAIECEWLDANPAALIPKPGTERARDRVLTSDELRAFWAATDEEPTAIRAWLRLRLLTAQRGGEVIRMRWSDVDLVSKWWTVPATVVKNNLAHRVPLNPPAVTILRELKAGAKADAVWVCASSLLDTPAIHDAKKAVARVRRRIGFDFRGHDLRRTAASLMTSAGVPRLVVAKILNHVETDATAVYDRHSYDAEKRAALDLWARQLQRILRSRRRNTILLFAPLQTHASSSWRRRAGAGRAKPVALPGRYDGHLPAERGLRGALAPGWRSSRSRSTLSDNRPGSAAGLAECRRAWKWLSQPARGR